MRTTTIHFVLGVITVFILNHKAFGQGGVGIGHMNPTELLHIKNGNLYVDTGAIFLNKTGVDAFDSKIFLTGNDLHFKGGENVQLTSGQFNNVLIGNFANNYVEFNGLNENVGIGLSPTYKLDVNGTARVNGFIMPTGAANGYVLTSGSNGVATWQANGASAWQTTTGIVYNENDQVAVGASTPNAKLSVINSPANPILKSLSIQTTKDVDTSGTITNLEIIGNQQNNGRFEGIYMSLNRAASTTGQTQGLSLTLNGNSTNEYMEGGRIHVNRLAGDGSNFYPVCGMHTVATSRDGTGATYGNRIVVCSEGSGPSYGVYSNYSTACSNSGSYYSGYFVGDVYSTGSYLPSDITLKQNIRPIQSSLNRLLQLSVNEYSYDRARFEQMNLPTGLQTGFLAQNVERVFPNLIKKHVQAGNQIQEDAELLGIHDDVEFKGVNYTGLIPHTVKAIQEQQQKIVQLEEKLKEQEAMIKVLQGQIEAILENR